MNPPFKKMVFESLFLHGIFAKSVLICRIMRMNSGQFIYKYTTLKHIFFLAGLYNLSALIRVKMA